MTVEPDTDFTVPNAVAKSRPPGAPDGRAAPEGGAPLPPGNPPEGRARGVPSGKPGPSAPPARSNVQLAGGRHHPYGRGGERVVARAGRADRGHAVPGGQRRRHGLGEPRRRRPRHRGLRRAVLHLQRLPGDRRDLAGGGRPAVAARPVGAATRGRRGGRCGRRRAGGRGRIPSAAARREQQERDRNAGRQRQDRRTTIHDTLHCGRMRIHSLRSASIGASRAARLAG